ncbi:MAG TPA: D-alanine--D-alanine ligase [Candidatus Saccharimonadales bacterium]|nr:D-alanine--D-alanine ligase [Candidatus Saccharimonadales bacterium]
MKKPTVAVFFGSRSTEHDVSIITAISTIIKPLQLSGKYEVVPVYIDKKGRWFSDSKLAQVEIYSLAKIETFLEKLTPLTVQFNGGLTLLHPGLRNKSVKVDVAFPATHGTYGEDGSLMGVFEMANVAYVGCNVASSAIAMDKVLARTVAAEAGVDQNKYVWFSADDFKDNQKKIFERISRLEFPLFVKPTHLGSSIAITKVESKSELDNAIEVALFYDNKVIIEEAVPNLVEVTVPVMGNHELITGNTEEPNQGDGFFDFETKYMKGGNKTQKAQASGAKQGAQGYSHIPARLEESLRQECLEIAKTVYSSIGASGIARVDLLVDSKAKKPYFNEVNPLPGSLYAHNWRSVSISNVQLVEKLVEFAEQRFKEQSDKNTTFSTNFLKQF